MTFVGIDPGLNGGIGILFPEGSYRIDYLFDLNNSLNTKKIQKMLKYYSPLFCIIEKAQSAPGNGAKSNYTIGFNYGKIIMLLDLLEIPYHEIRPMEWKKEFSLIRKTKRESVTVAEKLFPQVCLRTDKGRLLDGPAEALLMAEFGRRRYGKI